MVFRTRSASTRPLCSPSWRRSLTRSRRALLVGAVRRADERAREHRAEAEGLALLAEPVELVRVHPAVDRDVLPAPLQVLGDRDDVDSGRAQVAHRLDDLVVALAEADDDAALREERVAGELLRAREQRQGAVVIPLRSAHAAMQAADGFDVVVEDVRPGRKNGLERRFLDAE